MKQINEVKRMQQLAGILKEYDEEGSGYSYEYQEGPGATPKEIKDTIDKYLKNKIAWEKLAKDDFEAMAQGERADVKSEYYPTWKMSDFKEVINAMENSNLNEVDENEGWMYSIGSYVITAQKKQNPSIKGYISLSPNKDFTWLSPKVSDAIKFKTEEEAKNFIETEDPNLYSQIKDEYNIIDITDYTYQTN